MFERNDEKYLLKAIADNRAILFLGAGFSRSANNKLGKSLPTGSGLAEQIWEFLGYEGEYDNTDLGKLYANLLRSGKSHSDISRFLEDRLLCDSISPNYDVITKVFWHRIYSLNVDNLIEEVYKRNVQNLDSVSYPHDAPKERDQFLDNIQLVHLNGKLPCDPNELTFSPGQYGKRAIFDTELYAQFEHEYATLPTVFIGTKLDEPLLHQCIEARKARSGGISEQRSKSFLITRSFNQAEKDYLFNTFNIIAVEGTSDGFLEWLDKHSSSLPDRIKILENKLPDFAMALTADPSEGKKSIIEFSKYFHRVPSSTPKTSSRSQYLLGTTPKWEDIINGLDAPRELTNELFEHVDQLLDHDDEFSIVAILGSAGCGKSTILRRLGLSLSQAGKQVFITNSEELPAVEIISNAIESFEGRTVLLFDNAEAALGYLPSLSRSMSAHSKPPIIILASRVNDYDRRMGRFSSSISITEKHVPDLTRDEIKSIIHVLEENGLLGKLQGMNDSQRISEFEKHANKQILVAMRDATSGEGFDKIIIDEFESLVPEEAHVLYLCAALATESGFRLTEQELLGCSMLPPADTLHIIRRNLKNIIVRSGVDDHLLMIRHRAIADYIVTSVASASRLQTAYARLLLSIHVGDYNSRTEKLYRKLINHSIIYKRFEENLEEARNIYRSVQKKYKDNVHFWLQYGSLEMTYGSLKLAESYLNAAQSIDSQNYIVQNALGHLKLKQSVDAPTKREALALREEGSEILRERFEWLLYGACSQYDDPFPVHMYCSERVRWINHWSETDDERKQELTHLRDVIINGQKHFPNNKPIRKLRDEIEKKYLLLATK